MDTVFTLDWRGLVLAVALGVALFFLGGSEGLLFLTAMFFFLVISAFASWFGADEKQKLGVHERARGWRNVAANGVVPLFIAILYFVSTLIGSTNSILFLVAFLASVAAITADKFSSELGVLDKRVYMLVSMQRIKAGRSGGVSALGLLAGLFGAGCIALLSFVYGITPGLCLLIIVCGFIGDLADSVLGYFEDLGIGDKYTTNIACSACGALAVLLAFWLLVLSGHL
jgi:uncharacterized protein (TIGR00297 family)